MVEADLIQNFSVVLGIIIVGLLANRAISGIIGVKKAKSALISPEDYRLYKSTRDDADIVLKSTINRLRSQLGVEKSGASKTLETVKDELKEGADGADVGGAIEDLISGLPDTWQGIINPMKNGVIQAIKEEEAKEPGAFLKKVETMSNRLRKNRNGSEATNTPEGPSDFI